MKGYHNKLRKLFKLYKAKQNNLKYNAKIEKFQHKAESQFDICACKCKKKALCSCLKKLKAIKDEKEFSVDQRSVRNIIIESIDGMKRLNCKKGCN